MYVFISVCHVFLYVCTCGVLQSRSSILKDCCRIEDNSVLPPDTVVPPFTIFSGSPGQAVGELPSSTQDLMIEATRAYYQHFKPIKRH